MAHRVFLLKVIFWDLFIVLLLAKLSCSDRVAPNFVYILTDDQDLMLNGLVSLTFLLSFVRLILILS